MTYDKDSGLYINGVRPEKAKATFDFILDSLCEGATLVDITKPLERSRQTCVIVTRIDLSSCDPWGDGEGASFEDYSEKLWMASEKSHDYRGLSKIIYELMPTNEVVEFNDILRRAHTEHDLRMKGVIK